MAANEALNALVTTDANNSPSGSDVIGASLDNEIRSCKANIARSARWEATATVSAAATLPVTSLHKLIPVEGSAGGTTTITLPTVANAKDGFSLALVKVDATNNVIVDGNGAETIDGSATYTLAAQYESVMLICDGTQWWAAAAQGSTTLPSATVTGNATVGGTLGITGKTTAVDMAVDGDLSVSGSAHFTNAVDLAGTLTVGGAVTMSSTLGVTGKATFVDAAFDGDVSMSGTVVMSSKLAVSATASVGALTIAGAAISTGPTLGTEQATTSGTTIDFTSVIPATATVVRIMLAGVDTSGSDQILFQLGVGGTPETTGYNSIGMSFAAGGSVSSNTTGFIIRRVTGDAVYGTLTLTLEDATNNVWTASGSFIGGTTYVYVTSGHKALAGELDSIRMLLSGANTFSAGAINIQYE